MAQKVDRAWPPCGKIVILREVGIQLILVVCFGFCFFLTNKMTLTMRLITIYNCLKNARFERVSKFLLTFKEIICKEQNKNL